MPAISSGSRVQRIAYFLVAIILAFTAFAVWWNRDPRTKHGPIEVFYTDGATRADADRLGAYLLNRWGADTRERMVQLRKAGDGYSFYVVVPQASQNDAVKLAGLYFDAARIARDVFDGAAVELIICDNQFNKLKSFPPREDLRHGVVEGNVEVFYTSGVSRADAVRLAKYGSGLWKNDNSTTLTLARDDGVFIVQMPCDQDPAKDAIADTALRVFQQALSDKVFDNAPVALHLCDKSLNVFQVLRPSRE